MKQLSDVAWENFEHALARIGALVGTLGILNATLVIYIREAVPIVIGIPDDISLFGIPISMRELGFAVGASYFLQLIVLRNMRFIERELGTSHVDEGTGKTLLLGRMVIFNPFCRTNGRLGTVALLLSGSACVAICNLLSIGWFTWAVSERDPAGIAAVLGFSVLPAVFLLASLAAIYSIDRKLFDSSLARWRLAAHSAAMLATGLLGSLSA